MKTLTEELLENKIIYTRDCHYVINKFKLSTKYLKENNLEHFSDLNDFEYLFNILKEESSILIKEHLSYQKESSCILCASKTEFVNWNIGYKKYCSKECEQYQRTHTIRSKTAEEKEIKIIKFKKTCIEKYGVDNPQKVKEINDRSVKTQFEKYGGTFNLEKSKETKFERYGDENYNNSEKQQKTYIKNSYIKYGVRHYSQTGSYDMSRFKMKFYKLPSGKIISYQGYEDKLLDELLEEYHEDEIITERRNMPEIWYIGKDGKTHRYFPDVYITKTNTIYEVKSEWSLNLDLEKNELKFEAVKDAGFNFVLKVY